MKKKILLAFLSLVLIFLAGSILAALHVNTATKELEKILSLHKVDEMRQSLENSIRTVQIDLYSAHTSISGSMDRIIANVEAMESRADQCRGCH